MTQRIPTPLAVSITLARAAMPLAATTKTQPLGSGRLDRHRIRFQAQVPGDTGPHGIDVWRQPGLLADHGQIDVRSLPPRLGQQCGHPCQQVSAVRARPLGVTGRKMPADITQGRGTQQGIAQGMQGDIAVRMRRETGVMGNAHAAEHHMIARTERMDIEALSNTEFHAVILPCPAR